MAKQRNFVENKLSKPVINRLRERVLQADSETAIRIICDEIDWLKEEIDELRPKRGPRKFLPEIGVVLKKDVNECVDSFVKNFTKRYGIQPQRTGRLRRECTSLRCLLGEDAIGTIEHYLSYDTPYDLDDNKPAVKERHSMTDLLARAELFHRDWKSV